MISFHAFGTRFSLPLLTLAVPILAAQLGLRGTFSVLLPALGLHELAHIFAAKLAKVAIEEIRLMPFGGSARMENPYLVPSARLVPVAAAGPLANISLAVCFAAAAHWKIISPFSTSAHIHANLILFCFNLLPALPLDGGRMLFSLLRNPLGEEKALSICIWTGRILAMLLLLAAGFGFLKTGICNLSLVLASIFILASARDERTALSKSHARRMMVLLHNESLPRPLRFYQADASLSVKDALRQLCPREHTWFILSESGIPASVVSDHGLLDYLLKNGAPEASLGKLPAWQLPKQCASGAKELL